ncbi:MAG: ThiF family adenylyltransferase [Patescibacteria group bacterium]
MSEGASYTVVRATTLPADPDTACVYHLEPDNFDLGFYHARTDRNIGWITPDEQEMLRNSVIGVAGCGGMGGLLAATLIRLGVGEIRIADCETFDISNLNRQFAATRSTIDKSKAFETARKMREIADDTEVVVYPQGITPATVAGFLAGCDIVCDEIEYFAVGSRLLLHQEAERLGIPLLNCSTVGWSSRLFLFDHAGMNMESMLGFGLERAYELQSAIADGTASSIQIQEVLFAMLNALIPKVPEYGSEGGDFRSRDAFIARLDDERRASIIATNPPMASGFVANHALLYLLGRGADMRSVVRPPRTPGYLHIDTARMIAERITRMRVGSHDYTG